jgi:hypothetical protein
MDTHTDAEASAPTGVAYDGVEAPSVGTFGNDVQVTMTVQINAEMGALDWKQRDLAAASGVPHQIPSPLSLRHPRIPLPALAKIAQALRLTVVELIVRAQRRQDAGSVQ